MNVVDAFMARDITQAYEAFMQKIDDINNEYELQNKYFIEAVRQQLGDEIADGYADWLGD